MVKENVYIGHSSNSDYKNELYQPIRNSELNDHFNVVLPHEFSDQPFASKEFLKRCKYMIAEISNLSIGLGIELGWADIYGVEIIFIYKSGSRISNSLKTISNTFIEYENEKDLVQKLEHYFSL